MWSKGFAAEEAKAAFARASDLSLQTESSAERSTVYYARWIRSLVRSEMNSARMISEAFLREAKAEGRGVDAALARRAVGSTCLFQGELALARSHTERALADIVPEQEMDARRQFGTDTRILATTYLSLATWLLGDVEYARRLIEVAIRDGHASGHVATIVHTYLVRAILEAFRNEPAASLLAAELLREFAREHDIALYAAWGENWLIWARGRLQDPQTAARELRHALSAYMAQGNKIFAPHYYGLIAELEVMADRADAALVSVDTGLALAEETAERWTDPLLFRLKVKSSLSATALTWLRPKKPSRQPSPSRRNKERAASVCKRRSHWRSSTSRSTSPSTPTPSSRLRSKALRRRRKCPRSPRLWR